MVFVTGDPAGLETVSSEARAVLADLADEGPTEAEVETAREQLLRQYELFSNPDLVDDVLYYYDRDRSFDDYIIDRPQIAVDATAADLRSLARKAFPENRYIEVLLVPE